MLYGILVSIVWGASRTITRQGRQLGSVNSELETRVEERTAELSATNELLRLEVTDRERAEVELAERAKELSRSNADLEQFAYAASHDLQEPLRAIVGFTQIVEQNYKGRLDADADSLITRTVKAALRMQGLINDLLAYSRVGRAPQEHQHVNCETIVVQAVENLQAAIEEGQVAVVRDTLPTVMTNASLVTQVFNNLIANAIKFRAEKAPRVRVSAIREGDEWVFSVQDNGIGIDPQYADRIFTIFQRLHGRTEYEGTGIGLAICKKAMHRLGGRIWVDSKPGEGATFYFTIPTGGSEALVAASQRSGMEANLVRTNHVSANSGSEGGG